MPVISEQNTYDVIIVGAGPAGLYGGYYAGLLGMRALVLENSPLIGGTPTNFYAQKIVYDFPGVLNATGAQIVNDLYEQLKTVSSLVELKTSVTIAKLEPGADGITVTDQDGNALFARTLLLCTGTGVFTPVLLENAPQTDKIRYMVSRLEDFYDKDVIVLGGGDSAVDWANMIARTKRAKSVTIVHRRAEWPAKRGNVAKLSANGVRVLADHAIKAVTADAISLENNATKDVVRLDFGIMLVQYGQRVVPTSIHSMGLKEDRFKFVVGTTMQTSHERVFAAGNCCAYHGKCNTIANAMAEALTAVVGAHHLLHPKDSPAFYSSMKPKEAD